MLSIRHSRDRNMIYSSMQDGIIFYKHFKNMSEKNAHHKIPENLFSLPQDEFFKVMDSLSDEEHETLIDTMLEMGNAAKEMGDMMNEKTKT